MTTESAESGDFVSLDDPLTPGARFLTRSLRGSMVWDALTLALLAEGVDNSRSRQRDSWPDLTLFGRAIPARLHGLND